MRNAKKVKRRLEEGEVRQKGKRNEVKLADRRRIERYKEGEATVLEVQVEMWIIKGEQQRTTTQESKSIFEILFCRDMTSVIGFWDILVKPTAA